MNTNADVLYVLEISVSYILKSELMERNMQLLVIVIVKLQFETLNFLICVLIWSMRFVWFVFMFVNLLSISDPDTS